jgi:hypothetical protein
MDGKYSNLDPKTQKLLEDVQKRNPSNLQLQELKNVSDKIGKVLDVLQSKVTKDERSTGDLAELLFEIRDGIDALGNVETPEAPEMPDYASPVVDAVSKLEKALSASIKGIEVKPKVDVASPTVKVDAPKIDIKGIEKVLKTDIPKAFEKAIKLMPEDAPQDYTPLIEKFDEMAVLLESIDTASRMKPLMPNTLKVTNPDGSLIGGGGSSTGPVDLVAQDLFGSAVSGSRYNQVEIDFSTTDPDAVSGLTVTKTVGGNASNSSGQALFTTGTNTNSGIKAVTDTSVTYRPHAETFVAFTAIFTAGIASSYQRIGLYDDNNGFFIGYEGTSFGVTKRSGAVDTTTAKASFSEDTLSGQTGSGYTRNGTPEAIDFTKDNLFRIRFGWLGAAPIYFEVFSPDGEWVVFHKIKHPNTAAVPTIQNPNLPITLDVQKSGAGSGILAINTACWAAGTTSNFLKMTDTITDDTLAGLSRSVIAGRASSGGGTYYNVKVNPSGSLETNATITNVYTKETGSYSICNKEATATYKYFGFQKSDGGWYIMRKTIATNIFEYVAGASAYSTAWTNRASQTYTDYATAF